MATEQVTQHFFSFFLHFITSWLLGPKLVFLGFYYADDMFLYLCGHKRIYDQANTNV